MTKSEYELLKSVIDDMYVSDDEIEQPVRLFNIIKELLLNYEKKKNV